MIDVLNQTEQRLRQAQEILAQLQLFERWQVFGTPVLVGAVAYGLAMAPDIDMEIDCDVPRIEDGFVIYRLKMTVSQITCPAVKRLRRIGSLT